METEQNCVMQGKEFIFLLVLWPCMAVKGETVGRC